MSDIFVDVDDKPYEKQEPSPDLMNTATMQIGNGSKVFRADQSGIWLGAEKFVDAPFSVDMEGNLVASSADLGGTGYTKTVTFAQAAIPTSVAIGDLWVDTDDSNKMYRAASVGADAIIAGEWEQVDQDTYKLNKVGGTYTSTSTAAAAKVQILPDANTGLIAYTSDGSTVVFKVEVGGTNVGDVTIGNYAGGTGILWDQSAGALTVKGNMTAGTITGVTFRTAASGARVQIDSGDQKVSIYDAGNDECWFVDDAGGYISIKALDGRDMNFEAAGGDLYLDNNTHINGSLDMRTHAITGVTTMTGNVTGNCSGSSGSCTGNSATASLAYGLSASSDIDLNNNDIDDVASIDGGGNDIIFYDSISLNNSGNINNVNAINTDYIDVNDNSQVQVNDDLYVNGALSKNSGTFDIPHPDPHKPDMRLRHSFVESPTAGDLIYRYVVEVMGGRAVLDLPDYFKYLNENPQVWVSPVDVFGVARATIDNEKLVVEADKDGKYNILIIGTRKDPLGLKGWSKYGLEYPSTKRFKTPPNKLELEGNKK